MNQQGFSLISILVGLAVTALGMTAFYHSKLNVLRFAKVTDDYFSVQAYGKGLGYAWVRKFKKELISTDPSECMINAETKMDKKLMLWTKRRIIRFQEYVDDPTTAAGYTNADESGTETQASEWRNLEYPAEALMPANHKAAQARCSNRPKNHNKEKFEFCLRFLDREEFNGKDELDDNIYNNMFANRYNFAEIGIEFRDFLGNSSAKCVDFANNPNFNVTMLVHITIYWTTKIGGTWKFSKHSEAFLYGGR